jgi:phosphomannomutase
MNILKLSDIKNKTGIGFGTSGIRGLVTDLTDEVIYVYTIGFLKYLGKYEKVAIAGDLRDSTPRLMKVVAKAIEDSGMKVVNCGFVPTPAVAFYGISKHIPSIMVTGSHIPADRNGIKFYKAEGEILKSDEAAIAEMMVEYEGDNYQTELPQIDNEARDMYVERYKKYFKNNSLEKMNIGLYGHSAVGRDILAQILENCGAMVTKLGYSDAFIPVDTELTDDVPEWTGFEAVVSTDGDSDRPLLGDENGEWLRSDILGIMTAKYLNAEVIVNPISCNTSLERSDLFQKIVKTKIGSPYVIEEMKKYKNVVGYEANGGFMTEELPTRDAALPLLCWLAMAKEKNLKISDIFNTLPKRFTESGSVKDFPTDLSQKIVEDPNTIDLIKNVFGEIKEVNNLDGLRITLINEEIVHLRASKNAPEFRNYCEADSPARAKDLSNELNGLIKSWLNLPPNPLL